MFSLGMTDTYLYLNDPAAKDTEIEVTLLGRLRASYSKTQIMVNNGE
jgi:hypothetical protein